MFTEDCCKSNEGCDWSVLYANSLGLESEKFLALRWLAPLAPHWWRLFYSFVTKLQLVGTTGAHLSANENLPILKDGLFLLIYSYSYNDAYAIKLDHPTSHLGVLNTFLSPDTNIYFHPFAPIQRPEGVLRYEINLKN